jgi:hypothetical protein
MQPENWRNLSSDAIKKDKFVEYLSNPDDGNFSPLWRQATGDVPPTWRVNPLRRSPDAIRRFDQGAARSLKRQEVEGPPRKASERRAFR